MEKLKLKINSFIDAIDTLESSLRLFEKSDQDDPYIYLAFRDSVIKRFEYCHEVFWKMILLYLETEIGITVDQAGSRKVFKIAQEKGILTSGDLEICLEMIAKRNLTSHLYKEEIIEDIVHSIPPYLEIMKKVSADFEFNLIKNQNKP